MMWAIPSSKSIWPKLNSLRPDRVLHEVDGPRLFTTRDETGQLYLAYLCDEDDNVERFLLVPTTEEIADAIAGDQVPVRTALTQQALMYVVDLLRDGTLTAPLSVQASQLPNDVLPREGLFLGYTPETLLRVRLIGQNIIKGNVPASVVRRAVDGATNAVKALIGHVMDVRSDGGRPAEWYRRLYDLPATAFAFKSFEVSFGLPRTAAQLSLVEQDLISESAKLLQEGIAWANSPAGISIDNESQKWGAIVEALYQLTPPRKGDVERVEIGGALTGSTSLVASFTRDTSELISSTRKQLALKHPPELSFVGYVRELDKDVQTFWLRDGAGANLVQVSYSAEQFESVWLPFDEDRLVTVFVKRGPTQAKWELTAIGIKGDNPTGLLDKPSVPDSWGTW